MICLRAAHRRRQKFTAWCWLSADNRDVPI